MSMDSWEDLSCNSSLLDYQDERKRSFYGSDDEEYQKSFSMEEVYRRFGGFSKFQIFATVVLLSLEVPGAMICVSHVLTSRNRPNFKCQSSIIEATLLSHDEACVTQSCSGDLILSDPFTTYIEEWNIVCQSTWLSECMISIFMAGSAIGALGVSFFEEWIGKKFTFYGISLLLSVMAVTTSQATGVLYYGICEFFLGMAAGGSMVSGMSYLAEFITHEYRLICGSVSLWPLGEILLALLGLCFPDWRKLNMAIAVFPALILLTFPCMPESPRWLYSKHKFILAEKAMSRIAEINGREQLSQHELFIVQRTVLRTEETKATEWSERNLRITFRQNQNLLRFVILLLVWMGNAFVYYGVTFNMKNMSGNPFLNVFLLGIADWSAEILGLYFSRRYGWKPVFRLMMGISTAVLLTVSLMEVFLNWPLDQNDIFGLIFLASIYIVRFFNEGSFAIISCFTAETFPLSIRSFCMTTCALFAGAGATVSPLAAVFGHTWGPGPFVLFSAVSLFVYLISWRLREPKLQDFVHPTLSDPMDI